MTTTAPTPQITAKRCIQRLRTRLERWELIHLRALSADLHEQLEEARREAYNADRCAEMWQDMAMRQQEALSEQCPGTSIGLTQQGQLVLVNGAIA